MPIGDAAFYHRWVIANGWAEAAGLGTTLVLGQVLAPMLDRATGALMVLVGAVLAVLLGTLLEGVLVGVAQEGVLRQRVIELQPRSWIAATAVGAGLAWVLGMVPSTVMALSPPEPVGGAPTPPGTAVQYALAGGLGLVVGPVLGVAQWTVLRRLVHSAGRWLWANALAWGIGMPLIFFGMDYVPWTAHPATKFLAVYAVCGIAGLVVGAIHGRVLVRLLQSPIATSAAE